MSVIRMKAKTDPKPTTKKKKSAMSDRLEESTHRSVLSTSASLMIQSNATSAAVVSAMDDAGADLLLLQASNSSESGGASDGAGGTSSLSSAVTSAAGGNAAATSASSSSSSSSSLSTATTGGGGAGGAAANRSTASGGPKRRVLGRCLTQHAEPVANHNHDNARGEYILYVNDVIGKERRYRVVDILGSGTFGQVAKCQRLPPLPSSMIGGPTRGVSKRVHSANTLAGTTAASSTSAAGAASTVSSSGATVSSSSSSSSSSSAAASSGASMTSSTSMQAFAPNSPATVASPADNCAGKGATSGDEPSNAQQSAAQQPPPSQATQQSTQVVPARTGTADEIDAAEDASYDDDDDVKNMVAVKVVKNRPAYLNQGFVEIQILELLNQQIDARDEHRLARLTDYFVFRNHLVTAIASFLLSCRRARLPQISTFFVALSPCTKFRNAQCLVFELLSINLYELIKQNQFRGVSLRLTRTFVTQV
jgi:hypothetical protein